jgi:hypothetical protein
MWRRLMILGLLVLPGCGPSVDRSDLGQIEYSPKVPGADEPYDLGQLGPPPAKTNDADAK